MLRINKRIKQAMGREGRGRAEDKSMNLSAEMGRIRKEARDAP